jgi:hypothetical protein
VHKTANILDKMPRSVQGRAKQLIHEMYLSPTRKAASAAYLSLVQCVANVGQVAEGAFSQSENHKRDSLTNSRRRSESTWHAPG